MGATTAAKNIAKSLVDKTPLVTAVEAPGNEATMRAGLKSATTDAATTRARATATSVIPKMHKGGPVMKDGPYTLKAGEHVLTSDEVDTVKKHALMASGLKSLAKSGKK